jgi:hypothetical protein
MKEVDLKLARRLKTRARNFATGYGARKITVRNSEKLRKKQCFNYESPAPTECRRRESVLRVGLLDEQLTNIRSFLALPCAIIRDRCFGKPVNLPMKIAL